MGIQHHRREREKLTIWDAFGVGVPRDTIGILLSLLLIVVVASGCRVGPNGDGDGDGDGDADGDGDGDGDGDADGDGDGDADGDGDGDGDADGDGDGDADLPECEQDDSQHFTDVQCPLSRVDISLDVPGSEGLVDRVRYFMMAHPPTGDYDTRCAMMSEVVISRDSHVIRRGEAYYATEFGGFVLEGQALDEEIAICATSDRSAVVEIRFTGESPAGTFDGSCGCGCLSWTLSVACHRGIEASIMAEPWINDEIMSPTGSSVDGRGTLANHGSDYLYDVTFTQFTWQPLDGSGIESINLGPPEWAFYGDLYFGDDYANELEPGTWTNEFYLEWQTDSYEPPLNLCPSSLSGDPAPLSNILIEGSHSGGTFEIETHPFWCYNYGTE